MKHEHKLLILQKSIEILLILYEMARKPITFIFHLNSSTPQNQLMFTTSVVALLYHFSRTQK